MTALLLILGLVLLTAGGELLVRGASNIALRLGVSQLVIGLTIVGFGTSTPELGASVAAALRGAGDIAVGNVVGSNIFNIAVILGLTGLLTPIAIEKRAVRAELGWTLAAAVAPWLAMLNGGPEGATVGRVMGGVLVTGLVAYVVRAYLNGRRDPCSPEAQLESEIATLSQPAEARAKPPGMLGSAALVVLGLGLLMAGSKLLVDGAIEIARGLGVSELIIGLTVVAAGTSLPELVTSVMAAIRKKPELALGNILGSNVFNVFGILGVAALVSPQRVSPQTLSLDTPVMLACTVTLTAVCLGLGRLGRVSGALLLVGYAAYTAALIWLARGSGS